MQDINRSRVKILHGKQFYFCSPKKAVFYSWSNAGSSCVFIYHLTLKDNSWKSLFLLLCYRCSVSPFKQEKGNTKNTKRKSELQSRCEYRKKYENARNRCRSGFLAQGLKDGLSNAKTAMSDKDMETTMVRFNRNDDQDASQTKVEGGKNKTDGEAFLLQTRKRMAW